MLKGSFVRQGVVVAYSSLTLGIFNLRCFALSTDNHRLDGYEPHRRHDRGSNISKSSKVVKSSFVTVSQDSAHPCGTSPTVVIEAIVFEMASRGEAIWWQVEVELAECGMMSMSTVSLYRIGALTRVPIRTVVNDAFFGRQILRVHTCRRQTITKGGSCV
jgi:hypothetical protein